MTFCLDSSEIYFKLTEINYILKVAIKMLFFFKKRQLSQNCRHFKLAINQMFLLDDEKSVFLKWKRGRYMSEHKIKSPYPTGGDGDCRCSLSAQEGPAPSSANRSSWANASHTLEMLGATWPGPLAFIVKGGEASHQQGMVSPATLSGPGLCRIGYPQAGVHSSQLPAGQQPLWKIQAIHCVPTFVRATFFEGSTSSHLSRFLIMGSTPHHYVKQLMVTKSYHLR